MAKWYKKITEGIPSPKIFKKEVDSKGVDKCPVCGYQTNFEKLSDNSFVCKCGHHFRITSAEYFNILFDNNDYNFLFESIQAIDVLGFTDITSYSAKLSRTQQKTGIDEAFSVAEGKMGNYTVVVGAMDFEFIGGTMGSVMGEKIRLASDYCIQNHLPFIIVSKSGGARLMEGMYSLMQMVKTSLATLKLSENKIPFVSILTDPVMGGVTASFGMVADFVLAEPNALIGYTGPRIIKESTGKEPPKDFQTTEFLFKNGFIDLIVPRTELRSKVTQILDFLKN